LPERETMELKKAIEALLFSSARAMKLEEIAALVKSEPEKVKEALESLKSEYGQKDTSVTLIFDGYAWKLTVKDEFISVVQKVVTQTELSKTVLETLAVIAFRYPIKQADLIKIRTNKAYDHLMELQEAGFIMRQKHGRTKLIKLTDKFFEYFDLPRDRLKERFKNFEDMATTIEKKEEQIEKQRGDFQKNAEDAKKQSDEERKIQETVQIEEDERPVPLEIYESAEKELDDYDDSQEPEKPKRRTPRKKLGSLEVVDEPSEEKLEQERERIGKVKEGDGTVEGNEMAGSTEDAGNEDEDAKEDADGNTEEENRDVESSNDSPSAKPKSSGIKLSEEMEKEVDRKVERMLNPPPEESEGQGPGEKPRESSEEKQEGQQDEEGEDLLEALEKAKEEENESK